MAYFKDYFVRDGDTLQLIAQQQLGSIDQWRTLVEFNNLDYPYIAKTYQEKLTNPEGLVTYGDTIKLPITTDTSELTIDSFTKPEQQQIYDVALGMDIGINFGDYEDANTSTFALTANDSQTDLAYVSGLENLKQSLILRLLTEQGSLVLEPDYGTRLMDYIGQNINAKMISNAQDEIIRTILTDTRVTDATIKSATFSNGSLTFEVVVTPLNATEAFTLFMNRTQEGTLTIQ